MLVCCLCMSHYFLLCVSCVCVLVVCLLVCLIVLCLFVCWCFALSYSRFCVFVFLCFLPFYALVLLPFFFAPLFLSFFDCLFLSLVLSFHCQVVSHDADFLDSVCTDIVHLEVRGMC